MDQERAPDKQGEGFPIFDVYRRGYDPEQVDRYISDQQRRLDETLQRASESERKLAAAVGQLRELHRRVAMLEGGERSQGPSLDMLGERVQRILQEAWEGAYALRQAAERDVAEQREETNREVTELREAVRGELAAQREKAEREMAELVDAAERRAALMRAETDRRRQAYLDRVEEDRARAVNQITYLYDQRQLALGELSRLQASIESTVGEMAKSPLGVPSVSARTGPKHDRLDEMLDDEGPQVAGRRALVRTATTLGQKAGRMPGLPGLERPISASSTDVRGPDAREKERPGVGGPAGGLGEPGAPEPPSRAVFDFEDE